MLRQFVRDVYLAAIKQTEYRVSKSVAHVIPEAEGAFFMNYLTPSK